MRTSYTYEKSRSGKILFSERRILIESGDESFYVHPPRASHYIHGDIVAWVKSRDAKDGKMAEAKPIKLIKRTTEEVIVEARLSRKGVKWSLLPMFGSLMIEVASNPRVEDGDLYRARFVNERRVILTEKFGNRADPHILEELVLFGGGVRTKWPSDVEDIQIERPDIEDREGTGTDIFGSSLLPQSLSLKQEIFSKISVNGRERLDMRSWYTMTIDGSDAKDLDDAISIARYEGGDMLLGVHIADVAEYVTEGSPIDREAYLRGTSIYTPGRVIPMLPEILSNDLCSLRPDSAKLTLSILMRIDRQGQVKETLVTEGLIESGHRGIYEDIYDKMTETVDTAERDSRTENDKTENIPPKEILQNFQNLYHLLSARRKKEGKIAFETTECYFDLDEHRSVRNIRKRERGDAHMMIEEFMVLANEEIAKWCIKRHIPFLSRVHDAPSAEKMREIHDVISANISPSGALSSVSGTDIEPHHIRSILEGTETASELYRLSRLLLPKMAKALYKERPVRHYGLALSYYAHFTSPIRRYPDLLLHRMIKYHLSKDAKFDKKSYDKQMKKWGESLSEKERNAETISRTIDNIYMCRYMQDKVGESFDGIISGVTESNVYVELGNGVEGSIYLKGIYPSPLKKEDSRGHHTEKLTLDLARGSLRDTKGGEIYKIGESIRVEIASVNMETRRVEMRDRAE